MRNENQNFNEFSFNIKSDSVNNLGSDHNHPETLKLNIKPEENIPLIKGPTQYFSKENNQKEKNNIYNKDNIEEPLEQSENAEYNSNSRFDEMIMMGIKTSPSQALDDFAKEVNSINVETENNSQDSSVYDSLKGCDGEQSRNQESRDFEVNKFSEETKEDNQQTINSENEAYNDENLHQIDEIEEQEDDGISEQNNRLIETSGDHEKYNEHVEIENYAHYNNIDDNEEKDNIDDKDHIHNDNEQDKTSHEYLMHEVLSEQLMPLQQDKSEFILKKFATEQIENCGELQEVVVVQSIYYLIFYFKLK